MFWNVILCHIWSKLTMVIYKNSDNNINIKYNEEMIIKLYKYHTKILLYDKGLIQLIIIHFLL